MTALFLFIVEVALELHLYVVCFSPLAPLLDESDFMMEMKLARVRKALEYLV